MFCINKIIREPGFYWVLTNNDTTWKVLEWSILRVGDDNCDHWMTMIQGSYINDEHDYIIEVDERKIIRNE